MPSEKAQPRRVSPIALVVTIAGTLAATGAASLRVEGRGQPPRPFAPVPGAYQSGAWSHELRFEPSKTNPEDGQHVLRISYRGKPIQPEKPYDRIETPWGAAIVLEGRWIPRGGGIGGHQILSLTYDEMTKGRDVTPADAQPIRPSDRPTVDDIVADCVRALGHKAWPVRMGAINTLRRLGPDAAAAAPALAAVVQSRDGTQATFAVEALGFIGPQAKQALPIIERAAKHRDPNVRGAVAWAAARISGFSPQAAPLLESLAKDDEERVRTAAASALAAVRAASGKPAASEAVPALREARSDTEPVIREKAAAALQRIAESKEPPTPPADPQTAKVFITADPVAAVKKALPEGWEVLRDGWSGTSGCTIVFRDKARPGDQHAVLSILPPGAKERPGGHEAPDKTLASILKAANGEVLLWADPGKWTTIEQDLAKALTGEPMRVAEFLAEFRDTRGTIMEARIQPNWLQLLRFGLTQEKFEQACRRALAERPVADIRKVWVDTGSHRDMDLVDMGQVWTQVGRQWPGAETPLDQAMGRAASILRAIEGSRAEVFERGRMHMSTEGEHGRGGGFLTRVRCRQTFKVVEVLRGQPVAGPLTVQYGFVEESQCFPGPTAEQPIPPNTAVILVLDDKGELLKVLPDTEENRKAVKAAIEKVGKKPSQ